MKCRSSSRSQMRKYALLVRVSAQRRKSNPGTLLSPPPAPAYALLFLHLSTRLSHPGLQLFMSMPALPLFPSPRASLRQGHHLCHIRAEHPGGHRPVPPGLLLHRCLSTCVFLQQQSLPGLSCDSRLSLFLAELDWGFSPGFLNIKMVLKHPPLKQC